MEFDIGTNIKRRVIDNVKAAVAEYQKRPEVTTEFGEPVIGYVYAKHPLFGHFFSENLCLHPKGIYRPGNTVVVHFLPYARSVAESNIGGDMPSGEWSKAFYDSMHISMRMGGVIRDTLNEVGRLHSATNTPMDWNLKTYHEEWSHKLAAFTAGMGRFGIAGSFHTESGYAGRFGSILVDEHYAEEDELYCPPLETVIDEIETDSKYLGAGDVFISEDAIKACPAGAICSEGVDRAKCQAFCLTVNKYIPSPEVCGKCFSFDR